MDEKLSVEAYQRIVGGEDPEGLVHRLFYPRDYEGGRAYALSSAITLTDYQSGGHVETYATLAEVASGCWDNNA